jgi:plastocyanin domain-containing protein
MKSLTLSILVAVVLIGGAYMLSHTNSSLSNNSNTEAATKNNVSMVDGVQIIEISAKAGYEPRKSTAKAGIPTVLRFDTNGTFDCSASVNIPSMDIRKTLPQTGSTDIAIGSPKEGVFQGTCGMGMYPFEVDFQG